MQIMFRGCPVRRKLTMLQGWDRHEHLMHYLHRKKYVLYKLNPLTVNRFVILAAFNNLSITR